MARRIVVTRPAPEAGRWAADLARRGLDSVALPLIEIAPPVDPAPLRQARAALPQLAALFFVSGNAVNGFFESKGPETLLIQSFLATNCRAWAPGPGTAAALRAVAVPQARIDAPAPDAAQFDSEALWQVVQQQVRAGQRVLIVRGADSSGEPAGRDWLAHRLRAAGVQVDEVAAYRRRAPAWSDAEVALAHLALVDGSIWLLSSSQAIANLRALVPSAELGNATAIATHPRIAQAARTAGFGVVCESRPTLDSVTRSIESIG